MNDNLNYDMYGWMDGYECDLVMNDNLNWKINLSYEIQCKHI
jgi:hypothetical protein